MSRFNEYLICKERGHRENYSMQVRAKTPEEILAQAMPYIPKVCLHCGVYYWDIKQRQELNIPKEPKAKAPAHKPNQKEQS